MILIHSKESGSAMHTTLCVLRCCCALEKLKEKTKIHIKLNRREREYAAKLCVLPYFMKYSLSMFRQQFSLLLLLFLHILDGWSFFFVFSNTHTRIQRNDCFNPQFSMLTISVQQSISGNKKKREKEKTNTTKFIWITFYPTRCCCSSNVVLYSHLFSFEFSS